MSKGNNLIRQDPLQVEQLKTICAHIAQNAKDVRPLQHVQEIIKSLSASAAKIAQPIILAAIYQILRNLQENRAWCVCV